MEIMDLESIALSALPVEREEGFLEHILEDASARMHEINRDRRSLGCEKLAQGSVILPAQDACGRQVSDNPARPRPSQRNVCEHPIEIGMAVKAACIARALRGGERHAPIRRITDYQVILCHRRFFQRVTDFHEDGRVAAARHAEIR